MLSYLHRYKMKRGLRNPPWDHRHNNSLAVPGASNITLQHILPTSPPNKQIPGLAKQKEINTKHDFIGEAPVCVPQELQALQMPEERSFFCHASRTFFLGAVCRAYITPRQTGLCLQSGALGFHTVFIQNIYSSGCIYSLFLSWV